MKRYAIASVNKTEGGNYTAYATTGERVHIFGKQYEAAGAPKAPFFANAEVREYDEFDDQGKPNGEKFTRLTAAFVGDKASFVKAATAVLELDLAIEQELKALGTGANLSEERMAKLLENSI
jgi:hypothetical protein